MESVRRLQAIPLLGMRNALYGTSLGGGDKIAREMTLWELKGRHEFLTGKCNKEVCLNYILKE